jgi:hypothetical protein
MKKSGHLRTRGEGVIPLPPSFFFLGGDHPPTHVPGQQGVTPLPPQDPAGREANLPEKLQNHHATPKIPREIPGKAMQENSRLRTRGGGG